MIIPLITPIKVAFTVTIRSVIVRIISYVYRSSVFPAAGVVISFASGIIILFCYCAILTRYERKTVKSGIIVGVLAITFPLIIRITENSIRTNNSRVREIISSSYFICAAIGVVLISIVCINKRVFSPNKNLVRSY